jgi:hypothetical protein
MPARSLDQKLDRIRKGRYKRTDFIIADAKDPDMGFGIIAPGPNDKGGYKSIGEFRDAIAGMTKSGLVDVMLMSASSAEALVKRGVFKNSKVTPAIRFNDATDIWTQRGGNYKEQKSRPFATADLSRAAKICDLGLYSITFSNDIERDVHTLEAYAKFRTEAAKLKLRYFLEVFNPNFDIGLKGADIGQYVNDCIVRSLAGIVSADRPLFLKMQYNGPKALEELAAYDPGGLIIGILGGGAGTTRDTFELAAQSERYGARIVLFGRKIKLAESPLDLVAVMRQVVEGELTSHEAVKVYHSRIQKAGLKPQRSVADDLELTEAVLKN